MISLRHAHQLILPILLLGLASCENKQVTSYRVPKEKPFDQMSAGSAPTANVPLKWTKPPGWQEKTATGPRAASFSIQEGAAIADMSVIAFPGEVGGDLANINRWRGQLSLAPISESELGPLFTSLSASSGEFHLVELSGEASGKPTRILGAVLKQNDRTWFFKLMGDDVLVAAQKENFKAFLQSVKFLGSSEAASVAPALPMNSRGMDTNDLPRSTPSLLPSNESPAARSDDAIKLTWKASAAWREKGPSPMRLGSYTLPDEQGEGDLSVIAFPGEAGGLLSNLNRWRGQLKLPLLASADLTTALTMVEAHGLKLMVVDFSNEGSRILGAMVPFGGQTWFFKLTGPAATLGRQKEAFLAFLQTVQPSS